MRQKTVLHVYSGNLLGGVERMLQSLAGRRDDHVRHAFALCFEGRLSRTLEELGSPATVLGAVRLRKPLSVLRARKRLKELVRRGQPDAVICHGVWVYCVLGPALRAAGHSPILYLHDVPDSSDWYYRWAWRTPPRSCIVNSDYTATFARQLSPAVPISVVYPLVDTPRQPDAAERTEFRSRLGASESEIVILQASRLEAWKGHRNLLGALRELRDIPTWRCWIAGEAQRPQERAYRDELRGLVSEYGLDGRVAFIGHRDDMNVTLAASDIYCQANEGAEPFGMVFVEALYAGKPVVASALGGALEIVAPECGFLCPPAPDPVAQALRRLLEEPGTRAALGSAGPSRAASKFSAAAFDAQLLAALHTAGYSTAPA